MSKRVNNKRGNRAMRQEKYSHPTKVRGGSKGENVMEERKRRKLLAYMRPPTDYAPFPG